MKIKSDEEVFIIPVEHGIHLLAKNKYNTIVIDYLSSYFGQKKKTKCIVLDDEEDIIDSKNVNFIYIPSSTDLTPIFNLKPKTEINNQLSEFVEQNLEQFLSIERVREDIKGLLSDSGFFQFIKILERDINTKTEFDLMNFDIPKVLQLLRINIENASLEDQFMMLYNLLLYINRNQFNVIYIDFEITENVYSWLQKKRSQNCILLIDNEKIHHPVNNIFDSIILLNDSNVFERITIENSKIDLVSYLFHPIVRENIDKQTEKNIEFLKRISNNNSTFLVEFTDNLYS